MSREIKFRAWDKKVKRMVGVKLLKISGSILWGIVTPDETSLLRAEFELMEYTGLMDAKGKEMYEGDVVKWDGGQYTIIFSQVDGSWILKDDREDWECPSLYGVSSPKQSRIEIIGNVYENLQPVKE